MFKTQSNPYSVSAVRRKQQRHNKSDLGLNLSTRRTRKAVFLDEINLLVPWTELLSLIAPHVGFPLVCHF